MQLNCHSELFKEERDSLGRLHELAFQYCSETPGADSPRGKRLFGLNFVSCSLWLSGFIAFGILCVCVCGGVLEGTEYVAEGTVRKKERGKG